MPVRFRNNSKYSMGICDLKYYAKYLELFLNRFEWLLWIISKSHKFYKIRRIVSQSYIILRLVS